MGNVSPSLATPLYHIDPMPDTQPAQTHANSSVTSPKQSKSQESVQLIDLRIGLRLLGQEGRLLLAQYIRVKSQQRI